MRNTITKTTLLLSFVIIFLGFTNPSDNQKVHLKVTKEENGDKTVFEKSYKNMEELRADEQLRSFDLLVNKWISDHRKGIIVTKSSGGKGHFSWTEEDHDLEANTNIIVKKKAGDTVFEIDSETVKDDGEQIKVKKKIEIITSKDDAQEKSVIIISEDNDEESMILVDKDGNKTTLTKEEINKLKERHGENMEIHKKVEVIVTGESNDKEKNIIFNESDDEVSNIEVQVEKEIDADGKEVIKNKEVWITKNGEKVKLEDENSFHFSAEGDNITVVVDEKELDLADFSDGKFEGDKDEFFVKSGVHEGDSKQTMNVNIEEKNGETFIDIDIKRDAAYNVTISDIEKSDASLKAASFSIRNNLKPIQLDYYPNPNSGRFKLTFDLELEGEVTVKVLDIMGNEIYKEIIKDLQETYDRQLDLTGQKNGVYVLQVLQNKKVLSRKILIE